METKERRGEVNVKELITLLQKEKPDAEVAAGFFGVIHHANTFDRVLHAVDGTVLLDMDECTITEEEFEIVEKR